MEGERNGKPVLVWNYAFRQGFGSDFVFRAFWCAAVDVGAKQPTLSVFPLDAEERLSVAFDERRVYVDDNAFNEVFGIRAPKRGWVMRFLDEGMCAQLLEHPGCILQLRDNWLLLAGEGRALAE